MKQSRICASELDVQREELRGFSRSIAELEWLMLILVLLYFVVPGTSASITDSGGVVLAMVAFAVFVIGFHYVNFHGHDTRWKLALETWVMIAFITWVLWNTGKVDSPLLNLYLLVIIASALTLGKLATLMEAALISACYLYMGYAEFEYGVFSLATFSDLMSTFTPFILVAYLTTMLSADIQYAKDKIIKLSQTDELTGLLNMRSFNSILSSEVSKFSRYGRTFSVMMVDADGLKQVNDRFGHEAGNRLVTMIANTIQDGLRETDILARYGGDEFVVMLPEASAEDTSKTAQRIRQAVENTTLSQDGERISTTVSVGIANCPEDATDEQTLLDRADTALYRSKRSGRNQVNRYVAGHGCGSEPERERSPGLPSNS